MPAMAPAAPQPKRMRTLLELSRNQRPILEPMADPVEAIGASSPTLPPKATVSVEAISEVYIFLLGRREPLRLMASNTEGRPCPIFPRTTHACHRQAGIVDQGLQHYGRQSRQHTHHHRKQQYKTVLTQMTQTPTVDFAVKTHLFSKN